MNNEGEVYNTVLSTATSNEVTVATKYDYPVMSPTHKPTDGGKHTKSDDDDDGSSSGLSNGAIAGIVVAIAAIIMVVITGFCLLNKTDVSTNSGNIEATAPPVATAVEIPLSARDSSSVTKKIGDMGQTENPLSSPPSRTPSKSRSVAYPAGESPHHYNFDDGTVGTDDVADTTITPPTSNPMLSDGKGKRHSVL